MNISGQVAAFEGGQLTIASAGEKAKEAVLALPLNRLIVRIIKVPNEYLEEIDDFVSLILQQQSPCPDEPLSVSYETVRETSNGIIVIAAALLESSANDIAEALDTVKINITRVDALALGRLRTLWQHLKNDKTDVRRLVLIKSVDCISLFVLDDDLPCAVRAINLLEVREIMLPLLEAEGFDGAKELSEVVLVGDFTEAEKATLSSFAPLRELDIPDDSIEGVAERTLDPATLNAIPASWQNVLEETRFKSKLKKFLIIAGGIWTLLMATLFSVPLIYGFMTDHQKALSKEHSRKYREVKEMREKVKLVQKYSDHTRGALEILKAISDRLPEGVELNSWNFRREDGVRFSGESPDAAKVYELKDRLLEIKLQSGRQGAGDPTNDSDEIKLFTEVVLTGPSAGRGGKQRFDIDCKFITEEE